MKQAKKLLALTLALCLLSGCASSQAEQTSENYTICVVIKSMDSVFWMSVEDGLKQAASDYDVDVNVLWPEHEDDVEVQHEIMEDVIASSPDAIAVAPCDSAHVELLQDAKDADISCFYIDTSGTDEDFPYIGSDNYGIGQTAAEAMAKKVKTGTVAVITGSQKQNTQTERMNGFIDYIEQNTDLTVCEIKESPNSNDVESMACMQELLEAHADLSGVFCTSALIALGAMQQRDRMERNSVQLVGVDTSSDAMKAIEDGEILALVGQNGYQIGYQTVDTVVRSLNGEEIPEETYVENALITQENVELYLEEYLTERGGNTEDN